MPTKKRIGADPTEYQQVFLRRLEELRGRRNHGEFADFIGVKRTRYYSWRNDGATPGADAIRQIAERCEVSADWLLGIRGAAKSPTQAWDSPKLEAELSAEICRQLSERPGPRSGSTVRADGKQLLDRLVADEGAALEAWEEWQEHQGYIPAVLNVAAEHVTYPELADWLRWHAEDLHKDQPVAPPTRPPIARYAMSGITMIVPSPKTTTSKEKRRAGGARKTARESPTKRRK